MAGVLEPAVRGHGVLQEWSVAVVGRETETERGYTPHKTSFHRCCGKHRSFYKSVDNTNVTMYHHLISQAGWNRCNPSIFPVTQG